MSDPVMAADGHAYERSAIERWLATKSTSPMTGEELQHTCLANHHMLRRMIREPLIAHHAKALGAARSQGPAASAPQQQATTAAAVLGLCSQPIMWWSLYTLKTTGCGLPAGPFGLLGAAEGISYLVVIGFVAAALLSKATSGSGLPAGPGGLLGAAEGLSFLTAIAGLVVLGFQFQDYGYLPEAVPTHETILTALSGASTAALSHAATTVGGVNSAVTWYQL
ncbi:hypothetical protein EMIHUDRAFT_214767 [Emiliania huxleyi CCMP1516]|uniref:U-box domain-containing protein n=2 Tax=Emiliania huxleyi TaxID=2903 RepID=A0A0D3IJG8_EMIH1|nr:hypothetical protein EMIHUDRAFT_214767 [Emiliania huxleyi CCMP1516]EOD11403.1 hypothetical protein EMIHUDRAFT_214767 [Emiliania huxleyi CCMP1516]|eukprot:XP_005763832.1 hypothetical protein EMIHUDRAFT_214767 [Emiliania huxleyi CCMP1516]